MDDHVDDMTRSCRHLSQCVVQHIIQHAHCAQKVTCEVYCLHIPDGNQASYHAEVQGLPWDTLKGSAEMLKNATVRPGDPPRPSRGKPRKDGSPAQAKTTTTTRQETTRDDRMPGSSDDHLRQPTTGTDVIEQNIVMDSGNARVSDDGAGQGVLRMDQEEGISEEEQARRR